MYRVKMLIVNLLICGAAGVLMQAIWALVSRCPENFNPVSVLGMAGISGIIGTVCMFTFFMVTLSVKSTLPVVVLINMSICFALLWVVYFLTGLTQDVWALDLKWLIILLVSETTTFVLTRYWYKKNRLFRECLSEKKKALGESA
ncbi:MAG: hypothetical protein PHP22_10935 [Oscillospiraceae bacterium]|nr:hypothetical protein [Oscillospiraceae bacterium]